MHLIISTTQEETVAVKPAFEIWAAKFGSKIHRYNADNEIFSEKPFRSSITGSKQTIIFFGIRPHHQNTSFERKI